MKKSLIVLATLAAAGAAFAQSKSTPTGPSGFSVFGVVDVAMTTGSASGAGSTRATALTSSASRPSRLGFRGLEDMGGGLYAGFWLEGQIFADNGTAGGPISTNNQPSGAGAAGVGLNFNRRATVHLMSSRWGELRVGRDVNPAAWNLADYDPFFNSGVGAMLGVTSQVTGLGAGARYGLLPAGTPYLRASNMIAYLSPTVGGFNGQINRILGENAKNGAANESDGNGTSLRIGYSGGPFRAALGWGTITSKGTPVSTAPGAPSGDMRDWNLGGGWYVTKDLELVATFGQDKRGGAAPATGRNLNFGGNWRVGAGEVLFSVGDYRIEAGPGAEPRSTKLALGYVHNLSKRTALYASAAKVRNKDGARTSIGGAGIGAGLTSGTATGFDLGVRHFF